MNTAAAASFSAPRGHLVRVPFQDPRVALLCSEMDEEVGPRYRGREAESHVSQEESEAIFVVDPATIVSSVLVLAGDGEPVGHGALRDLAHDGRRDLEVKRVFVRPHARGSGVSRLLMAELECIALERGASRLILQTGDRQPEAVALYTRLGYTPIPVFEPYTPILFSRTYQKLLSSAGTSQGGHPACLPGGFDRPR